jgi:hypothetical protein
MEQCSRSIYMTGPVESRLSAETDCQYCCMLVSGHIVCRVVDIVGHNKMTNWVAAKVHARIQNIHPPSKQETTEQGSFHLVLHFEECS